MPHHSSEDLLQTAVLNFLHSDAKVKDAEAHLNECTFQNVPTGQARLILASRIRRREHHVERLRNLVNPF